MDKQTILEGLQRAVIEGDLLRAEEYAGAWLEIEGLDPMEAVKEGLTPGMEEVGRLYEEGEFFLPELVSSSEAMKAALNILRPAIVKGGGRIEKGAIIMATVEGDIHEIGKSVVSAVLEAGGFRVFDLGANVKLETLYTKAEELAPDIIGLSALLTTTMINQKRAIEGLRVRQPGVKVMVGGAPVTRAWAQQIGADGFGKDAFEAVEVAEKLIKKEN